MKRLLSLIALSVSMGFAVAADKSGSSGAASGAAGAGASSSTSAGASSSASGTRPTAGSYSGTLQQEGGSGTSDIKLNIKHITADGRVTARIQAANAGKACGASLPASGIITKEGGIRLEVDAGAPEGCERIYNLQNVSAGSVSGTFIQGKRRGSTRGDAKKS